MRSDKPTDIFCEKKKIPKRGSKFPHLVTKNMRAVSQRPRLGLKNVCYPNLNSKKLDFYILKGLDQ